MEITNRDDLRVGDVATFSYNEHEFTGPVWENERGTLFIGAEAIRYVHESRWSEFLDFVRATRPAPALPTEPGSVIEITAIDENPIEPTIAMLDAANDWMLSDRRDERWTITPYRITEWRPMKVVPA